MKKEVTRSKPLSFSKETLGVLHQGSLEDVAGGITPVIPFTVGLIVGYTVGRR